MKDIIKTEVIEAEVLDENGIPVGGSAERTPKPPRGFAVMLRAVGILVFTFLFSVFIASLAVLIFVPLLILKMFGLVKSDVRIFKL